MITKFLISIRKFIQNLFSGSDPANQLQKLVTGVMPYAKCQQAHADSGSPVLEANNVCAGGEEGMIYVMLIEIFLSCLMNEFQFRLITKYDST